MPPSEWRCQGYYGDNRQCDCGCGARDIDCSDAEDVAACDSCMGCGDWECRWDVVDPTDITQCLPPPEGWICNDEAWGGNECDCGCGAPDFVCNGYTQGDICYSCPEEGCAMGDCTRIDPMDNTQCL
jgi:hypothetical protein